MNKPTSTDYFENASPEEQTQIAETLLPHAARQAALSQPLGDAAFCHFYAVTNAMQRGELPKLDDMRVIKDRAELVILLENAEPQSIYVPESAKLGLPALKTLCLQHARAEHTLFVETELK